MNPSRVRRHFNGKTKQLQKLCVTITDCHHSTPKWFDSGKWVVRSENIKSGRISLFPTSYTDEVTFRERISRAVPEPGDLIITREAPMGEVGMIPNGVDCCLGQRLVLIKPNPKKIDASYLLYAMQSEYVQRQIGASDATGSTVSNLRIPLLKEVLVPLLDGQEEIGQVLATIDAKIDLNERINAELEALVQTIYDYWFVQFEFPDENGQPYKSSGGKMVWNEKLKREIPEGWGEGDISSIAEVLGGGTPSKKNASYWNGEIPFFTPTDANGVMYQLETEDWITRQGLENCSSNLFEKGTIFITARGSVGKLAIASRPMAMNQSCYALRPKIAENYPFVYQHAKTLIHHLRVKASGSTFDSIITNDISWTRLVAPEAKVVSGFCDVVRPCFEGVEVGLRQALALRQLRDWLLPLLMNGQARVA